MVRGTTKTRAGGRYTEAAFWGFVRQSLRKGFHRWPPGWKALEKASRPYKGPDKRRKKEYQCASCGEWFKQTEVEKDHIHECGSLKELADLPYFVYRLACEEQGYQILCKPCHLKKEAPDDREEKKKFMLSMAERFREKAEEV